MTSFYVGPSRPLLRVASWEQLLDAARVGVLTETQWVELKAALPAAASKPNLELARDLASLSVDGGVLVIGVRDPGDAAELVVGTDDALEALKSRVDQVAGSTRIQPPLHVQLTAVPRPDEPTRHVLLVEVPASPAAPHMVDGNYWGRGATGKRPLTDAEASRLWAERRGAHDSFEQRLRTPPAELTHLWASPRRLGWGQLLLEPLLGRLGPRLTEAVPAGIQPLQLVVEAGTFRATWSPNLHSLNHALSHPDGLAAASFIDPADLDERYLLHLLLRDDGQVRVLAPTLTPGSADGATLCISVNHLMELTHQALQLAAHVGEAYLGYTGGWKAGFYLEGLVGQVSAQSLGNHYGGWRPTPFQTDTYVRSATVSSADLLDHQPDVVAALLGDLARGLDLQTLLFPYDDPRQIRDRS